MFFAGARSANPLTIFLVIAITFIPVAGVAEQALATGSQPWPLGWGSAPAFWSVAFSHAFFPDAPAPAQVAAPPAAVSPEAASWSALQATLVVMPVFVLALTNPAFYLAAIMKTVTLGQQAGATNAQSAGRELVGSTLMGALMAAVVWFGLIAAAEPVDADVMDGGCSALGGRQAISESGPRLLPPSFWANALVTMLILLGPAIEDAAVGKDVYNASAVRVTLFVGVALYAWATVWALERWRASRSRALVFRRT